ncbi:MAG: nucleotidyltransferase domain-containing protein [Pirellulales bacterium]|nr:nucleotidyltransferase domain-containing protein [Pirellulales bacterium]
MPRHAITFVASLIALVGGTASLAGSPARAVAVAVADLAQLPDDKQALTRYLWFPSPSDKTRIAAMHLINTALSHTATPLADVPGSLLARQAAWHLSDGVIRIDLAIIGGDNGRVERLRRLWESLVDVEPYFTAEVVELKQSKQTPTLVARRIPTPALPELVALIEQAHSALPIVRGDWLMSVALQQINGGRYYDFRGLTAPPLTRDRYLEVRGLDVAAIAANRDIARAVVAPRQPTGSPGSIVLAWSTRPAPTRGAGLAALTFDIFEEDQGNAEFDAERNLLGHKFRGQEIIVTLASGFHEYTLWDAEGRLVDEAPPNLAADKTIQPPGLPRLNPPLSCIRCHGQQDGWLDIDDRVRNRLAAGQDILGDYSMLDTQRRGGAANASPAADATTFSLLAGLYLGDLKTALNLGRDTHAGAVFLASGGRDVPTASAWTADVFASYVYAEVTAERAALELGLDAIDQLPARQPDDVHLIDIERFPMSRKQWEAVYQEAAARVAHLWTTEKTTP